MSDCSICTRMKSHNPWHIYGTNKCDKILYFLLEELKENSKDYKKCSSYIGRTLANFNIGIKEIKTPSVRSHLGILWLQDFIKNNGLGRYNPKLESVFNNVLTAKYRNALRLEP